MNAKITIKSLPPGSVTNKIMQVDVTSEGTSRIEDASGTQKISDEGSQNIAVTVTDANPSSEGE